MQLPAFAALTLGCASLASAWSPHKIIEEIAPKSKACPTEGDFIDECRSAEEAAPFIFESLYRYGLYHRNEQAAVISLMALESGEFQYKKNHFPEPGRPGQGTANMQMAEFNLKYAKSIPAVQDKVANVTSTDGLTDEELNRIRALVIVDEHNFGSAAWFLRTQCGEEVAEALRKDVDSGFKTYMECVGVEVDESRQEYLDRAKSAFCI